MLTVKQTVAALKERDLFKEIIVDGQWLYDVPEKLLIWSSDSFRMTRV